MGLVLAQGPDDPAAVAVHDLDVAHRAGLDARVNARDVALTEVVPAHMLDRPELHFAIGARAVLANRPRVEPERHAVIDEAALDVGARARRERDPSVTVKRVRLALHRR